jgi:phosphoribosylaminoimidazole-succinocarboxamide synthase
MKLLKIGKTKDVYQKPDGKIVLKFKDTVTGHADGSCDPGGNQVVGEQAGVASGALKTTAYYFKLLKQSKIPAHFVKADLSKNEMTVKPAVMFGSGLEFVCRYKACGGFIRRFGGYAKEGDVLPGIIEVTLKDDQRDDPPVTKEIAVALKIITAEQFDKAVRITRKVCDIVKNDLAAKGLELIDIKVEFGLVNGKVVLIDEISAGNMRVCKNGKKLDYLQVAELI